jgi:hypothetical protein
MMSNQDMGRAYPDTPPNTYPDVDLDRVWIGVAAEVWHREPRWPERVAGRLLRSPGLARALLTTPALLVPWLVATVTVVGAGALARLGTGQSLTWIVTPALAAAGIAYAYGPGIDPAWELSASMPVSDRMVLLVRALAVFAVNALLGLAASAASGQIAALTFGWLLPMTAVCGVALAVATVAQSANAGAAAGMAAWLITVVSARVTDGQLTAAITSSALLLPYLAAAVCCTAIAFFATRIPKGMS